MDFGLPARCASAMVPRDVDRAEAENLGFAVNDYEGLVEQAVDVEMSWVPQESEGGGPASGYEASTRLSITLELDGFEYYEFDPERCNEAWCMPDGGTERTPASCEPYLYVLAHGELETADGAIRAKLAQQIVRVLRADADPKYVVAAQANLSEVRGTLRIDPAAPEPYVGVIYLSVHYTLAREFDYAVVSVNVFPDWDARGEEAASLPEELARYNPVDGEAGSPP